MIATEAGTPPLYIPSCPSVLPSEKISPVRKRESICEERSSLFCFNLFPTQIFGDLADLTETSYTGVGISAEELREPPQKDKSKICPICENNLRQEKREEREKILLSSFPRRDQESGETYFPLAEKKRKGE